MQAEHSELWQTIFENCDWIIGTPNYL